MNFIPPQDEGRLRAAASGVLPNGKAVVVNADGTVSSVFAPSVGSQATFEDSASVSVLGSVFDSNSNKVVVAFKDAANSSHGTAVVGTISGTDVSFGTAVVFNAANTTDIAPVFDSNSNKVVIFYRDEGGSRYGAARVGTISGTGISFGTEAIWNSALSSGFENGIAFNTNINKFVIAFRDGGNSNYGTTIVGTVSGTDISFGSEQVFESATTNNFGVSFDSNQNVNMIAYTDSGNSAKTTVIAATVSNTTLTFGSPVVASGATAALSIDTFFDPSTNKGILAFTESGVGKACSITLSGTSISLGTVITLSGSYGSGFSGTFDSDENNVQLASNAGGTSGANVESVKITSGTTVTSGSVFNFGGSVALSEPIIVYDTNVDKFLISYLDGATSDRGKSQVLTLGNLTAENYIGMSGGAVTFVNQAVGSPQVFESANSRHISSAFDSSNNKIVITYGHDVDGSKSGKAVVGTVTGNSISFGTPVVFESAEVKYTSVVFDSSNNKFVIAYEDDDNSDYGTAIVGTVSGTTISFGTAVVFESAAVLYVTSVFDSNSNKVVIAYTDDGNSGRGTAIVGTVSGTNISFGSATVFNSGSSGTAFNTASFDSSNNKVVIAYSDNNSSQHGTAIVGTVSGTSISFGSEVVFEAATSQHIGSTLDSSNNKVVIVYSDEGNSSYGTAIVGTVSGTSISFGTAAVYETGTATNNSATFDTSSNKVVIAYQDAGNSNYGTFISGTVSGTSISFDTATVFEAANSDTFGATFDSNSNKVVIAYRDTGNSNYGTGIVVQTESTNRGQVASGSSASVDIIGTVSENQTGLTAGQSYFVQTDGTIGLTAGSPSVFAGTAISATKLLVKT